MLQGGLLGFWSILLPAMVTALVALVWRAIHRGRLPGGVDSGSSAD